ncbi:hypothetical protein [Streptomyces sp. Ac-502]|uniref:hypothetical protein n=1 Tax=Streptomyces sp. Ac-502 TaxID=3342801 RepID=UPI0038622A4D
MVIAGGTVTVAAPAQAASAQCVEYLRLARAHAVEAADFEEAIGCEMGQPRPSQGRIAELTRHMNRALEQERIHTLKWERCR